MAYVARFGRRFLSTSTVARSGVKHSVATPAPHTQTPLLTTPELQQLAQKAAGHWKELNKQEFVQLYHATYPQTFKQLGAPTGEGWKAIAVAIGFSVLAIGIANFLRDTVGPTKPHTFQNKEWEADTREKLIRQKANPIEGISSKITH